jgi:hypothetical protein
MLVERETKENGEQESRGIGDHIGLGGGGDGLGHALAVGDGGLLQPRAEERADDDAVRKGHELQHVGEPDARIGARRGDAGAQQLAERLALADFARRAALQAQPADDGGEQAQTAAATPRRHRPP